MGLNLSVVLPEWSIVIPQVNGHVGLEDSTPVVFTAGDLARQHYVRVALAYLGSHDMHFVAAGDLHLIPVDEIHPRDVNVHRPALHLRVDMESWQWITFGYLVRGAHRHIEIHRRSLRSVVLRRGRRRQSESGHTA